MGGFAVIKLSCLDTEAVHKYTLIQAVIIGMLFIKLRTHVM